MILMRPNSTPPAAPPIAAVLPQLFHDFKTRSRTPGGFHLANAARDRMWNTVDRRLWSR